MDYMNHVNNETDEVIDTFPFDVRNYPVDDPEAAWEIFHKE